MKFNFSAKITESVQEKENSDLFIEGIAINETVTRNGITYSAVELEKSAPSLMGKPILKDHEAKVDSIVGRVTESGFDKDKIKFKARIPDKEMKEKIKNGLVQEVSIGAGAEIVDRESKEKGKERIATNIQFYELSFVAIPGDPGAGVTMMNALAESFKIKEMMKCPECKKEMEDKAALDKHMAEKHKEEKKMEEITIDASATLKKELEETKKEVESLLREKKEAFVKSILEINESLKKEDLMKKSDSELQIMREYEKKLSEKVEAKMEKPKSETKAEVGTIEEKKSPLIVTANEMYVLTNKDGTFPEVI